VAYLLPIMFAIVLCCPGANMFEAYRQKCSAEDLSRLKVSLCSGEALFVLYMMSNHCFFQYWIIFNVLSVYIAV